MLGKKLTKSIRLYIAQYWVEHETWHYKRNYDSCVYYKLILIISTSLKKKMKCP